MLVLCKTNLFRALRWRQRADKRQAPNGPASRRRQSQGYKKGGQRLSKLVHRKLQADQVKQARKQE